MENESLPVMTVQIDRNDVVIRESNDSDIEELDALWKKGDDFWASFGRECLHILADQRVCPNKGFVAVYKGKIIGSGFTYQIGEGSASLGGFFVAPEYRFQGIGQMIWDTRVNFLGDQNVICFATEMRAPKNKKLGFNDLENDILFYMNTTPRIPSDSDLADMLDHVDSIQPIGEVDLDQVMDYDMKIVKNLSCRKQYYQTMIRDYQVKGYVAFKKGAIVGLISEMPAQDMVFIGPWYADCSQVAIQLLKHYLSYAPREILVMIPCQKSNTETQRIMGIFGMEQVGKCQYMYTKHPLDMDMGRVYSYCNVMLCM